MAICHNLQVSDLGFCDRETANLGIAQHSPRQNWASQTGYKRRHQTQGPPTLRANHACHGLGVAALAGMTPADMHVSQGRGTAGMRAMTWLVRRVLSARCGARPCHGAATAPLSGRGGRCWTHCTKDGEVGYWPQHSTWPEDRIPHANHVPALRYSKLPSGTSMYRPPWSQQSISPLARVPHASPHPAVTVVKSAGKSSGRL